MFSLVLASVLNFSFHNSHSWRKFLTRRIKALSVDCLADLLDGKLNFDFEDREDPAVDGRIRLRFAAGLKVYEGSLTM